MRRVEIREDLRSWITNNSCLLPREVPLELLFHQKNDPNSIPHYLAKFCGGCVAGPSGVTYAYRLTVSKTPRKVCIPILNTNGAATHLGQSAIDYKISTVDEAALVAREEQDSLGLFDGLAEAAAREVDFAAVAFGGVVAEPVLEEGCAGFF